MYHVLLYGSEYKESQNTTCLVISYHQSYAPHTKDVILELYLHLCMSIHNMLGGEKKKSHVECMNLGVTSSKTCFTVCDLYILLLPCTEQMFHCIYLFVPPTIHRSMKERKPVGYRTYQDNTYTCI